MFEIFFKRTCGLTYLIGLPKTKSVVSVLTFQDITSNIIPVVVHAAALLAEMHIRQPFDRNLECQKLEQAHSQLAADCNRLALVDAGCKLPEAGCNLFALAVDTPGEMNAQIQRC